MPRSVKVKWEPHRPSRNRQQWRAVASSAVWRSKGVRKPRAQCLAVTLACLLPVQSWGGLIWGTAGLLSGPSADTVLWLAACCHPSLPREPPGPQDTSAVGLEAATPCVASAATSPTSLCSHCDHVAVGDVGQSHELAQKSKATSSSQRHTPAEQRLSQREQDPPRRPEPGPAGLHAWSCPRDPVL